MAVSFREALKIAQKKYPYRINHYEEYEGYFVFDFDDGTEYVGGDRSPIVIRKSDFAALNYAPIFFDLSDDAGDVGDILAEGDI